MGSVSSAHQYLHFSLYTFHNIVDVASAIGVFHLIFFVLAHILTVFFYSEIKIYLYVEIAKLCLNLTIQNIIEVNNSQNVEILGKFLTSVAKQKFFLLKIFQFHFNFCSGILVKHLTRGLVQLLQSFFSDESGLFC